MTFVRVIEVNGTLVDGTLVDGTLVDGTLQICIRDKVVPVIKKLKNSTVPRQYLNSTKTVLKQYLNST